MARKNLTINELGKIVRPEPVGDSTSKVEEIVNTIVSQQLTNMTTPMRVQSNWIQSQNFQTGVAGWNIDALGNCEFNNGYFRGNITGASGTFSGTISANNVTAGTLVGSTVVAKTGTTGSNVTMDSSSGAVIFKYDNTAIGSVASDSTASMLYSSNASHLFFGAGGASLMTLNTDGLTLSGSRDLFLQGGRKIQWSSGRNIYDGGDDIAFAGSVRPGSDHGYNCGQYDRRWNYVYGSIFVADNRFTGKHSSSDDTAGGNWAGGWGMISSLRWNSGTLQAKVSTMIVKDGLITGLSEGGWYNV